ncbi:zinc finger protein 800 [Gastrophryne carolinensis]
MEKKLTSRKTHYLRNKQSKHEMDVDESRLQPSKIAVRDKYSQTDHGCCNPESTLEPGDPPLLQQPAQTSKPGILQIIECFRSGTKQLRLMLLREVDTIFECKSCRSLFRGLPNLIAHKQFYCLSKHYVNEDPPREHEPSQPSRNVQETVYPQTKQPELVVLLEPIQTNKNAVFQTIKPVSECSVDVTNTSFPSKLQKKDAALAAQPASSTLKGTVASTSAEGSKDNKSVSPSAAPSDVSNLDDQSTEKSDNGYPFLCLICKKDFNCRRGVRRHIKRVHKKKIEDVKKFIRIQLNKSSTTAKGHVAKFHKGSKSCHLCHKSFATKANTRRHVDEVHKGVRREYGTQENTKPNVTPEPVTSKKSISRKQKPEKVKSEAGVSYTCPDCKRCYTSKFLLKKHVKLEHQVAPSEKGEDHVRIPDNKTKTDYPIPADKTSISVQSSPKSESKGSHYIQEKKSASVLKSKAKSDGESPKGGSLPNDDKKYRKPKLSAGFDFKHLYCKLCKRQFTSKQNLVKHIELHTDGNCIYVKFYRCPLCTYETRRKRDVIRHITVVHKKSQRALIKITSGLESRAVKKPIESILDKVLKKNQKDKSKKASSKPEATSSSASKKSEVANVGTEVKLTKNILLLKCNTCSKAFAKKKDLDLHKKNHKTKSSNSSVDVQPKGRSTRSKAV